MANDKLWSHILNYGMKNFDVRIPPERLMALTDGVFAIAITLLILGIVLPDYTFQNSNSMESFLKSSIEYLIPVIISFVILGEYWIQHHYFMKIKKINILFLWLNIFYLLFIMFIPFTTSLMCRYEQFKISQVLFGIIITLTSLMSLIMYWYAAKTNLLEIENSVEHRYTIKSFTYLIIITIIINLLICFVTPLALVLFLLIPIISVFLATKRDKNLKNSKIELYDKSDLLKNIKKDRIIEFMFSSKIESYINKNHPDFNELSKKDQMEIKIAALDDLQKQHGKLIEKGKQEIRNKFENQ